MEFNNQQKGLSSDMARMACVGKVSDKKRFGHSNLKILTPTEILEVLARVKVGNKSENLLNEIRQIISCMCRAKEIAKKVYNNIMTSIKL